MTKNTLPPVEYICQCFRIEAEEGKIYWRVRPEAHFANSGAWKIWNRKYAGAEAFNGAEKGYRKSRITYEGKQYPLYAHRVVMAISSKAWPETDIDHINGNIRDNRIVNLRRATRSQNMANRRRNTGKKLPKGVYRYPKLSEKYIAAMTFRGKSLRLGAYPTAAAAKRAYDAVALLLHGEYARPDRT